MDSNTDAVYEKIRRKRHRSAVVYRAGKQTTPPAWTRTDPHSQVTPSAALR